MKTLYCTITELCDFDVHCHRGIYRDYWHDLSLLQVVPMFEFDHLTCQVCGS